MSGGGLLWSLSQGYSAHLASMDRSGSSKVSSVQDVWDVYRRVFVLADLVLALRGIQFHQKLKQFFGGVSCAYAVTVSGARRIFF